MKITPQTKIALGLPRGKCGFDWVWIMRLLKMFAAHPANYLPIGKCAPHASARNQIVHDFLQSEAEYLLWIDSDTVWEPHDIQTLANEDKDIITGIQYSTSEHQMPLIRKLNKKNWTAEPIVDYPMNRIFEIDGCGFGFCLTHRRVYEAMKEEWFEFRSGFSEDLTFCFKAKNAGFKTWAHPKVQLGHISSKVVTYKDFTNIPKSLMRVYAQKASYDTAKWLEHCHPNWKNDLQLYGVALDDEQRDLMDKAIDMAKPENDYQFLVPNINTKEYWDEVYSKEGSVNETWRNYPGKFPFLSKELLSSLPEDAMVLELGSGMGVLLKQLKEDHPKFKLFGIDISEVAIKSVNSIEGVAGMVGVIPEILKDIPEKLYDAVISCELMEHLDDEPRLETVKEVHRILKKGGTAIFTLPDNIMPPSEEKEHRICYTRDKFEEFIRQVFPISKVYSKRCLVSDKPCPGGTWGKAPFLFGVCKK